MTRRFLKTLIWVTILSILGQLLFQSLEYRLIRIEVGQETTAAIVLSIYALFVFWDVLLMKYFSLKGYRPLAILMGVITAIGLLMFGLVLYMLERRDPYIYIDYFLPLAIALGFLHFTYGMLLVASKSRKETYLRILGWLAILASIIPIIKGLEREFITNIISIDNQVAIAIGLVGAVSPIFLIANFRKDLSLLHTSSEEILDD